MCISSNFLTAPSHWFSSILFPLSLSFTFCFFSRLKEENLITSLLLSPFDWNLFVQSVPYLSLIDHFFTMAPNAKSKGSSSKKAYTWEEISKHNSAESAWVYHKDKVYDITKWIDKHPGGSEMLLLSAGRDITDMLPSYHPFTLDNVEAILAKYEVGTVKTTEFPRYEKDNGFYAELCSRVGKYFEETGKDPKGAFPGLARLVLILTCAYFTFMLAYDQTQSWLVRILAAQVFGVCQALPLLHSMHDCSHTSLGHSPWGWRIIGRLTMDWIAGASFTSWHNQHVIGHHLYTNVMGVDPDLPVTKEGDLRRVAHEQKWTWVYKFQHVYLLFLYGLLGLKFRIQDIVGVITAQNGRIRVNQDGLTDHYWQAVVKVVWFIWRIYVPIFVWGIPAGQYFALFLISEFMTGWFLAFNFQVSHVSPSAVFPSVDEPSFKDNWAAYQVRTTVDYGHNNAVTAFFCGALNYQIEHHLFPGVSQYHYPAIAPIVKEVCKKHNVNYTYVPTFWKAFLLHVEHLKTLGNKPTFH